MLTGPVRLISSPASKGAFDMWLSGWTLVPSDEVQHVVTPNGADVEPWDYPSVKFSDGEVDGSDIIHLWSLLSSSSVANPLWDTILRDAPDGEEKIAVVRPAAIEAFAALTEDRISQLALAWQKAESSSGSLAWWKVDGIRNAIRELSFLARQQLQLRNGYELLMIWFR
jgi:hypothetical protein